MTIKHATLETPGHLPMDLKLPKGWPILASITSHPVSYVYVTEIGMYCAPQHRRLLELIRDEMSGNELIHGTGLAFSRGCRGPMCGRYRRERDIESNEIHAFELKEQRRKRAEKAGVTLKSAPSRAHLSYYERLKGGRSQYASIDALLVMFCVYQYKNLDPTVYKTYCDDWYKLANDMTLVPDYLKKNYGTDVI